MITILQFYRELDNQKSIEGPSSGKLLFASSYLSYVKRAYKFKFTIYYYIYTNIRDSR